MGERNIQTVGLEDAMERYQALFNRSLDAVYLHDFVGNFFDANEAALTLLGYTREDIPTLNFSSLLSQEDLPQALANLNELLATGTQKAVSEFRLRSKDGGIVTIEAKASVIYRKGQPHSILGIARDITARKRLDEQLRSSERLYRLLADNMNDSVWLMDMDLHTLYCSPSSERLRGYTIAELMELPLEKHLAPESLAYALSVFAVEMEKLKADPAYNTNLVLELEFFSKDGSTFWTENNFTVLRGGDGAPSRILATGRDISQRKKAEDELKRSYEKLQKTVEGAVEMISMISEVRDPYTSGHQKQVAQLASAIAEEMGLPEKKVSAIRMAGTLHDIGKINIPSEILSKPGKLNPMEFELIKSHPAVGKEILKSIDFPWPVCSFVSQHHERLNGSGYPEGLKGAAISIEARILAVADTVSAMSSHRPYRAALGLEKALEEISLNRGSLYDPEVVDACLRLFKEKGYTLP